MWSERLSLLYRHHPNLHRIQPLHREQTRPIHHIQPHKQHVLHPRRRFGLLAQNRCVENRQRVGICSNKTIVYTQPMSLCV